MFAHSVIVNTAVGTRRWQYDIDTKRTVSLQELKDAIVNAVRDVPGVLRDPEPEALIVDVSPDSVKVRILWSTHDARQHQMLGIL